MPPLGSRPPAIAIAHGRAQIPQSTAAPVQSTAYVPILRQSITSLNVNGSSTSKVALIALVVSCALLGVVVLTSCIGCLKPAIDHLKLFKVLEEHNEAVQRGLASATDGATSNRTSQEQPSDTDAESHNNHHGLERHTFKDREHKAYRDEIKRRRLVQAQKFMRSSQGLSLPVHFQRLKGKMKALSRSLAATDLAHEIVGALELNGNNENSCTSGSESNAGDHGPAGADSVPKTGQHDTSVDAAGVRIPDSESQASTG